MSHVDSAEPARSGSPEGGEPTRDRELRAQGRRTLRRLLEAGRDVFAERGFHSARVDDIVTRAETSHGTFYLYFSNKDDLLGALVRDCEQEVEAVASRVPPLSAGEDGYRELRSWIGEFDEMYRAYGPVIRTWIEAQPGDTDFARRAADLMRRLRDSLEARLSECGACSDLDPKVAALAIVAMIERFAYLSPHMAGDGERDAALDTVARIAHRGLFATASDPVA